MRIQIDMRPTAVSVEFDPKAGAEQKNMHAASWCPANSENRQFPAIAPAIGIGWHASDDGQSVRRK
ncbi:hypothetical protein [Acidisoma silvae]|uniref:Uncharacterized protein n=1 Tax=Acidisoma silvae TaxID=2802396 RepID=A0A963YPZ7_9PROT|nr:hypothetical protein [Acidisoma silvae]MCB8874464.1 hypothetical protein [Acidisoma silvae]